MRNHGQRYPLRGGARGYGPHAGLGALNISSAASGAYSNIGARLAKV